MTVLQRTGLLVADARKTEVSFRPAYRWMTAQMYQRVGKTSRSPTFPIWAWRTWKDSSADQTCEAKVIYLAALRGARIEFIRLNRTWCSFRISCFGTTFLNYWYLPASRKDERAFESTLKKAGLDFSRTKPIPDQYSTAKFKQVGRASLISAS
ncbi:MAG: DUF3841 domain-containing protein [Sulfuritalea sp.]|nr:DUF3841 domain-containing protein [Sulfuritalea sp.]